MMCLFRRISEEIKASESPRQQFLLRVSRNRALLARLPDAPLSCHSLPFCSKSSHPAYRLSCTSCRSTNSARWRLASLWLQSARGGASADAVVSLTCCTITCYLTFLGRGHSDDELEFGVLRDNRSDDSSTITQVQSSSPGSADSDTDAFTTRSLSHDREPVTPEESLTPALLETTIQHESAGSQTVDVAAPVPINITSEPVVPSTPNEATAALATYAAQFLSQSDTNAATTHPATLGYRRLWTKAVGDGIVHGTDVAHPALYGYDWFVDGCLSIFLLILSSLGSCRPKDASTTLDYVRH